MVTLLPVRRWDGLCCGCRIGVRDKVPEIVGKDFARAEEKACASGKDRSVPIAPESTTVNTVLEQLPKAGETVKWAMDLSVVSRRR